MNPRRPSPTGPKPVSFDQTRTPPPTTPQTLSTGKGKIVTFLVKLKNLGLPTKLSGGRCTVILKALATNLLSLVL